MIISHLRSGSDKQETDQELGWNCRWDYNFWQESENKSRIILWRRHTGPAIRRSREDVTHERDGNIL